MILVSGSMVLTCRFFHVGRFRSPLGVDKRLSTPGPLPFWNVSSVECPGPGVNAASVWQKISQ